MYLLSPRSSIDPREVFAKEPLLAQEPKVGLLGRLAAGLQRAIGCRISLLSRLNERFPANGTRVVLVVIAKASCVVARVSHQWSSDISHFVRARTRNTFIVLYQHQFITLRCLHDRPRRGTMLPLAVPTPERRARPHAHPAGQSLPDHRPVRNAEVHLVHARAVPPARAAAVVPIAPAAHQEVATVVPLLQCPAAQK